MQISNRPIYFRPILFSLFIPLLCFLPFPANAEVSDAVSRGIYEFQDESYEEAVSTLERARSATIPSPIIRRMLWVLAVASPT